MGWACGRLSALDGQKCPPVPKLGERIVNPCAGRARADPIWPVQMHRGTGDRAGSLLGNAPPSPRYGAPAAIYGWLITAPGAEARRSRRRPSNYRWMETLDRRCSARYGPVAGAPRPPQAPRYTGHPACLCLPGAGRSLAAGDYVAAGTPGHVLHIGLPQERTGVVFQVKAVAHLIGFLALTLLARAFGFLAFLRSQPVGVGRGDGQSLTARRIFSIACLACSLVSIL